jgi:hypothetical protein
LKPEVSCFKLGFSCLKPEVSCFKLGFSCLKPEVYRFKLVSHRKIPQPLHENMTPPILLHGSILNVQKTLRLKSLKQTT